MLSLPRADSNLLSNSARERIVVAALGGALALFGLAMMAGWVLRAERVVRLVPGFLMVFDTAFAFAIAGLALVAGTWAPASRRAIKTVTGAALMLLGTLILYEYLVQAKLGIDWPRLHTWLIDPGRNLFPGRPSRATAVGVVLAGVVFVLTAQVRGALHGLATRVLCAAVGALGTLAVTGYLLDLPTTLDFYFLTQVSLPTAICFIVLALGLWRDWQADAWSRVPLLMSMRRRLSLALPALLLLPMLVMLSVNYLQMRQAATASAEREVAGKVTLAARHIDELVTMFANDVRAFSVSPVFQLATLAQMEDFFLHRLRYQPLVAEFDLVDRDGLIVATTAPERRGLPFAQVQPQLDGLRQQALVARPDALFVGVSGDAQIHAISGVLDSAGAPSGQSSAVLIATLDSMQLLRRVMDLDEGSDGDEFAYLVERSGRIVMTGDLNASGGARHPLAAQLAATSAHRGSLRGLSAHVGRSPLPPEQMITGFARVGPFGDNRAGEWFLVTSLPIAEILEPTHRLFGFIAGVMLAVAAVVLLLAWRLAASIYRPLSRIVAIAARFGSGDLAARARVNSGSPELNRLAFAFNDMAVRIDERNGALARAHSLLRVVNEANRVAGEVIRSAEEGVMVLDAELHIESVNPAFEKITGFEAAQALGQTPRLLFPGEFDDAYFSAMRQTLEASGTWQGDIWTRRRSGELYPQQTSLSVLRDAEGRVSHYAAVFRDRTREHELESSLRALASMDGLTGIANRRSFDEHLAQEWLRALRQGQPLSVVMIDIDHFKRYNDRYGHPAGDACLHRVAQVIAGAVRRAGDLAARYGGEEFAVILPNADAAAAAVVAEKICACVAALALPHEDSATAPFVTLSLGVATVVPQQASLAAQLLAAADRALYAAKAGGRNRVGVAGAAAPRELV